MNRFKKSIITILIASIFMIYTCTTDNSITGNTNQVMGKTSDVSSINSPTSEDSGSDSYDNCVWTWVTTLNRFDPRSFNIQSSGSVTLYKFRDNYLAETEKGSDYINYYYELSKYGIKNNLVNKYYTEHYELLKSSIEIAYSLQHRSNPDQILINKNIADDLKNILKVYRSSPNHREIEPVLDYLEADLDKYYNKPKYEIAVDFE